MMDTKRIGFLLKLAYRDSLKNIGKLILFMSSIIAGVAALVAINSFNHNLSDDIDAQAATLLGADLSVTSNKAIDTTTLLFLDSLPGDQAEEMELLSMAYILKNNQTQFVRLKGMEGDFPFYGKILTTPAQGASKYKSRNTILVDNTLMLQHGLLAGDSIKLGDKKFAIEATLNSTFGSSSIASSFAPTIYISKTAMLSTGLIQPGSLVQYARYYKVPKSFDIDEWKETNRRKLRGEGVRSETIEDRKENLKEAFGNLNYFLNLVGLVSLLLGCIGVASSVFIYVRSKVSSIAVLRCLGIKTKEAFFIFFAQISILGFIAVVLGVIIGSLIQVSMPILLKDFLPMQISLKLSWPSIINGLMIGSVITALFALLPLMEIRQISPLRTLRSIGDESIKKDKARLLIFGAILISLFLFLWRITGGWREAAIFTTGILIVFLILYYVSVAIVKMLRKAVPANVSFEIRQGVSNLYRPNNQTTILLLSLGLGTAILSTLYLIQGLLLNNVTMMDSGNQPNTILYGIESNQLSAVEDSTSKVYQLPVIQSVPIVTMKLEGWKGKSKTEWLRDTTTRGRGWAMNRELRVSYRDSISTGEQLIKGNINRPVKAETDTIYISLADSYAEALGVELGDEIVFNVQGALIKTYLGSIRKISFNNMSTRFFILFPTGVLEKAPQFHVMVTKTPDAKTTARYRSSIVRSFPNVSVVDLGSILKSVNEILNKVSAVIKFMAIFSLITGIIVLISSLLLSKYQRINESVLLRTLGTKRWPIYKINFYEYLILGLLSSLTGVVLSVIITYFLARFQFRLDFILDWTPIVLSVFLITGITVLIGLYNSREVVNNPPLEVLRKES